MKKICFEIPEKFYIEIENIELIKGIGLGVISTIIIYLIIKTTVEAIKKTN